MPWERYTLSLCSQFMSNMNLFPTELMMLLVMDPLVVGFSGTFTGFQANEWPLAVYAGMID